ncbi:jg5822 [Pararge aegeria aegeria]|uniref:Jg5822 protein n=1 Tax=Pararge aegeria aegeria TaxID=348720 RepID=A0A8S4RAN7_9NEOP|nr:jg5822 [Pararge aegeria aegeria]
MPTTFNVMTLSTNNTLDDANEDFDICTSLNFVGDFISRLKMLIYLPLPIDKSINIRQSTQDDIKKTAGTNWVQTAKNRQKWKSLEDSLEEEAFT